MQRAKDVRIAYIGGGSRGWAWGLMTDIALDAAMEGEVRLYDIDRDAAEKNKKIGEIISRGGQPANGAHRGGFCGHFYFARHL